MHSPRTNPPALLFLCWCLRGCVAAPLPLVACPRRGLGALRAGVGVVLPCGRSVVLPPWGVAPRGARVPRGRCAPFARRARLVLVFSRALVLLPSRGAVLAPCFCPRYPPPSSKPRAPPFAPPPPCGAPCPPRFRGRSAAAAAAPRSASGLLCGARGFVSGGGFTIV